MRNLQASITEQRSAQNAEGCVKTAVDLARYRMVMEAVKPDLVIETGTFSGKSALWFAQWCDVLTIDVHDQVDEATRAALKELADRTHPDRVMLTSGVSSTHPHMVEIARRAAEGRRVLVSLDSDHSAPHVLAEMHAYGPLVTVGSYLVVEDTIVRWLPDLQAPLGPYVGSPLDAVDHYFDCPGAEPGDPVFMIDAVIEDEFPTTQFPSGWLRRIA